MKIVVRVNDTTKNINIPLSWDQVTFRQFLALSKAGNDYAKVLSIFTGMDEGVIKRSQITGLSDTMYLLSYVKKQCPYYVPNKLLFYPLAKDLGFESIAQYEDIRSELESVKNLSPEEQLAKYPLYCAVYACKHMSRERCEELARKTGDDTIKYGDYHFKKAEAMQDEFFNCPAPEVLGVGNFILLRFISLNVGINPSYLKPLSPLKKLRLVFKRLLLRSGLPELLYTWKKKLA
jgi:hypothetical protein